MSLFGGRLGLLAMPKRRRRIVVAVLLLAVAVLVWHALPRLSAMAFILRVAKSEGILASLARLPAGEFSEEPVFALPTRHGPVPARKYLPSKPARRTTLLVPGVHMDGIHEARLVGLAKELAATGLAVLTVAPPDLARYRVTTKTVDELEDAIAWAASQAELAPDGKVGITAFSFAGGLALVAAGRPAVKERVAFAFSFGGHADLLRVLRYLCVEGEAPSVLPEEAGRLATGGEHIHIPKPHDYGGVVALLNLADFDGNPERVPMPSRAAPLPAKLAGSARERLVPAPQVQPLQAAITLFLQASSIDRLDHARAREVFAEARHLGEAMPEPSRTLMKHVSEREVVPLGRALSPLLAGLDLPAALSPERSPLPSAPVFLLHGADDSVVPASEMLSLVRKLGAQARVHAFASRLITHAEANRRAALVEMWQLAGFWRELMAL